MSIFASQTAKTIAVPMAIPHTVTIRKLSGRHLEQAAQETVIEATEYVRRMGGDEFRRELAAALPEGQDVKQAIARAKADPFQLYDKYVVCKRGVTAWTFDIAVSDDAIEDLDADVIAFLATEILRLSKPSLFQSEETAQKETAAAVPIAERRGAAAV